MQRKLRSWTSVSYQYFLINSCCHLWELILSLIYKHYNASMLVRFYFCNFCSVFILIWNELNLFFLKIHFSFSLIKCRRKSMIFFVQNPSITHVYSVLVCKQKIQYNSWILIINANFVVIVKTFHCYCHKCVTLKSIAWRKIVVWRQNIRVNFITETASFHGCRVHEIDKQKYLLWQQIYLNGN